jgi:hypothetical protein
VTSTLPLAANIDIRGNVTGVVANVGTGNFGNVNVSGQVTTAGNVSAAFFIGNGSQLTGINQYVLPGTANIDIVGNIVGTTANIDSTTFGNVYVNNDVSAEGNVSADFFIGNGAMLTGISQYVLPSVANIDIVGNVTAPGNVSAKFFIGNLIGNSVTSSVLGVSNTFYLQLQGNNPRVTFDTNDYVEYHRTRNTYDLHILGNQVAAFDKNGNLSVSGNIAGRYFIGNVEGVFANINSAAFGNVRVSGQVTATGNVSATFFIGNGALLTGIDQYVLPGTANIDITGNVTGARANVGTGNFGNVSVSGQVTTVGNVSAAFFVGNGSLLTGIAQYVLPGAANIDITGNVTGTYANVGTGNFGNVNVTGQVTTTGNVSAAFFIGNVIGPVANTGVGNFGNVNVTGQVTTTGNVSAAFFVGNASQMTGVTATSLAANIGKITGQYCVAMNGNDSTADGSENKPFLTIQAAHDRALAEYPPDTGGSVTKQVQIYVYPGVYPGTANISRYNTVIRGAGSLYGRGQMTSIGPVNVNCANAAYVYNNTVSFENLFFTTGLVNTGTGIYTLVVDSCYINGGVNSNGVITMTNTNSPVYITTSYLSSSLNTTYINANTGLLNITDSVIQTAANGISNGYLINVGGNCVLTMERCYINSVSSNNAAIYVSNGALMPGYAIKVTLTGSFVQNTLGTGIDFGTTNAVGFFIRNNWQVANGRSVFAGNGIGYQNSQLCTPGFSNTKASTFTLLPIPSF